MKFVFALIALAAIASVNATEDEKAKPQYSKTLFYSGVLDSAQGAIEDIVKANQRLTIKENQLELLEAGVNKLYEAENAMEAATTVDDYKNSFLDANLKAD